MEGRIAYLKNLCRVGGEKLGDRSYPARGFKAELKSAFNIDITHDDPNIHPEFICVKCQLTAMRSCKNVEYTHANGGCGSGNFAWEAHHRTKCGFCERMREKKKGGRPQRKQKSEHAHATPTPVSSAQVTSSSSSSSSSTATQHDNFQTMHNIVEEHSLTNNYAAKKKLTLQRFVDKGAVAVIACRICACFPEPAVEVTCCRSVFCSSCLTAITGGALCPHCSSPVTASSLVRPSELFTKLSGKWSIHCDYHEEALNGCPAILPLENLKDHVESCPFSPTFKSSCAPVRAVRPTSTVADVLTASPSKLQGNVAEQLTGHLVKSSVHDGKLEVKTCSRGRPQIFTRTTACSVPSDQASASTIRRRASELERVEEFVSGGASGVRAQEVAGLRRLPPAQQQQLLQDLGLVPGTETLGATVCCKTALAIKADLALPHNKFRQLRRWLKSLGVEVESERAMRSFVAIEVPKYTARNLPMMKKNGDIEMAATVYFPNLIDVI